MRAEPVVQPAMVRRAAAAQATLDAYQGKAFIWGRCDCARLAAFHMKQLGITPRLAAGGAYKSQLGARRALVRAGHDSLAAAIDAHGLLRIPPAFLLVGDIVQLASADTLGSLTIALGNGRVLGWHDDAAGAVVMQPATLADAIVWQVA